MAISSLFFEPRRTLIERFSVLTHIDTSKLFVYIFRHDSNIWLARDKTVLCDGQIAPITVGDFETGGAYVSTLKMAMRTTLKLSITTEES